MLETVSILVLILLVVAFITAIPATISVQHKDHKMVEINFLCVHSKIRKHRLAPVLISEITRRVNITGIFQVIIGIFIFF